MSLKIQIPTSLVTATVDASKKRKRNETKIELDLNKFRDSLLASMDKELLADHRKIKKKYREQEKNNGSDTKIQIKTENIPQIEHKIQDSEVKKIINNIKKADVYKIFWMPVTDKIVPGYSNIIKKPRDLQTIRRWVGNKKYKQFKEFKEDILLMYENAMYFNKPETIYHKEAQRLKELSIKNMKQYIDIAYIEYGKQKTKRQQYKELAPFLPTRRSGRSIQQKKEEKIKSPEKMKKKYKPPTDESLLQESLAQEITQFEQTHDFDYAYKRILTLLKGEDVKGVFKKGYYNLDHFLGKVERGVYREADPEHTKFQNDLYGMFQKCLDRTHHNSSINKQGKRMYVLAKQIIYHTFFPERKPPSFFDVYGKKPVSFDDLALSKANHYVHDGKFYYDSPEVYNFPQLTEKQHEQLLYAVFARFRAEDSHGVLSVEIPADTMADYYEKLAKPIHFGSILEKIEKSYYPTFNEFFKDLDTAFANLRHYYPKTTPYNRDGIRFAHLLREITADIDLLLTAASTTPQDTWDIPSLVRPCSKTEALYARRGKYQPPFLREKLMRYTIELLAGNHHAPWQSLKDAVNRSHFVDDYEEFVAAAQQIISDSFQNREALVLYADKRFQMDRDTIDYFERLPYVCDKVIGRKIVHSEKIAPIKSIKQTAAAIDRTKKIVAAKMAEAKRSATAAAVAVAGELETSPLDRQFCFIRPSINSIHSYPSIADTFENQHEHFVKSLSFKGDLLNHFISSDTMEDDPLSQLIDMAIIDTVANSLPSSPSNTIESIEWQPSRLTAYI